MWSDSGQAIHLPASQRGGIFYRLAYSILELPYPVWQAGDSSFAPVPVSGRQIMKNLSEAMSVEFLGDFLL